MTMSGWAVSMRASKSGSLFFADWQCNPTNIILFILVDFAFSTFNKGKDAWIGSGVLFTEEGE